MKKEIFILIMTLVYSFNAFCQSSKSGAGINSFDSKGKKNGFWSEKEADLKVERYYLHGVKNGIKKVYYRNGSLMTFLEYKNGQPKGIGYFFHEKGYLGFTVKYMGVVTYRNEKLQRGYFTIYNINGSVKESGIGLFKEGEEEIGDEIRIGKWKKY